MKLPGSDRPLLADFYPGAWLVLLAPIAFGIYELQAKFAPTLVPPGVAPAEQVGVNYEVYYYAADALLEGQHVYDVSPPGEGEFYEYLYPPITILVFLPTLLVSPTSGYWLFLGLNGLAAAALTVFAVRYVEDLGRPLGWLDVALVFAFCYGCSQMVTNAYFGNVNLLLGTGVAAGLYLLEVGDRTPRRESIAGACFAVVALFKLFPALLGLYLLRIRAWWATAAAIAVGIGGLLAGELLFAVGGLFGWETGDGPLGFGMTVRWLQEAILPRGDTHLFVGGLPPDAFFYVTIQRPLSHVLYGIVPGTPAWLAPVLVAGSFAIGLAVAIAALRRLDTRFDRLVAAFAVASVAILVMPSLQYYVALSFLPIVVLAYLLDGHPFQPLFVVGGIVLAYAVWPAGVLDRLDDAPAVVQVLLDPIAATTSTQLLGLAIMLLACGLVRRRGGDAASIPARALEPRPAGPPLRRWFADRGVELPGSWDPTRGWSVGATDAAPAPESDRAPNGRSQVVDADGRKDS
ncbi:hypothetical protein L593_02785 [Salinarchaeum sp. Harcht-Bsk1]|uniref:glycosyltransferase family 87 protein n=1 Tax=Salinarchaeum sp. Harcht-Bsk1 TaxID=1333523 RepID=UPI0003423C0F|nr:glycosyltransferase family 87 protein [Salinarchaeum sp. Harcht-Bsk1]AGN00508.1 hypothetical protein L593_02785 [Salinarchaeum sp. Harcht-Bsk1]